MRCAVPIMFACLAVVPLRAHHGPVGAPAFYDTGELVILEGELTEVFWRNPHVRFELRVVDESGEEVFWELETGVPSQMESGGFTADMFPVGGQVKAAGFVSRHRSDFLGLRNMLLPNGLEYVGGRGELIWSDRRLEPGDAPYRERQADRPEAEADSIFGIWGMGLRPSEWMAGQDYDHVLSEAGRAAKDAFRPIDHPILRCVPRGMPERMLPGSMEFEERFTVILAEGEEPARLGYRLTATDPVMFNQPLVIDTAFNWSPRGNIETSSCELWERSEQGD